MDLFTTTFDCIISAKNYHFNHKTIVVLSGVSKSLRKIIKNKYWYGLTQADNVIYKAIKYEMDLEELSYETEDLNVMKRLIELYGRVNNPKWDPQITHEAYFDRCDKLKYFLDSGDDIETKNNNGDTVLCEAIQGNAENAVKMLLERGAETNITVYGDVSLIRWVERDPDIKRNIKRMVIEHWLKNNVEYGENLRVRFDDELTEEERNNIDGHDEDMHTE